jgi:hypothetical protein
VYTQSEQRHDEVAEMVEEVKVKKRFTRRLSKRSMITHHADEEHNVVGHLVHTQILQTFKLIPQNWLNSVFKN